jgi:hypothetical protein
LISTGEQSGLLMHIAAMDSVLRFFEIALVFVCLDHVVGFSGVGT